MQETSSTPTPRRKYRVVFSSGGVFGNYIIQVYTGSWFWPWKDTRHRCYSVSEARKLIDTLRVEPNEGDVVYVS